MTQACFLVAVVMLASVIGRATRSLQEETDEEFSLDKNVKKQRRQARPFTCGQILAPFSKRDDQHAQPDPLDKILGENYVAQGWMPWQVNIYENGNHICGGAILNGYWILTAAWCVLAVQTSSTALTVVVGDNDMSIVEAEQRTFSVARVHVRDAYIAGGVDYNIALIKIVPQNGSGIRFNNYIQPVCLPSYNDYRGVGDLLTISGWGVQSDRDSQPSNLLKLDTVVVLSNTRCRNLLRGTTFTERQFCAFNAHNQSSICRGDIGGPAVYVHRGAVILGGIIAYDDGCSNPNQPVILTHVSNFFTFIATTIPAESKRSERLWPIRPVWRS